ncbi:hypothetical protein, partial [Mycolicibacterium holsaticum]|uniref:hypothetical protein n=1 Tax=Mycolicibacterium holsaticum TaxID=152142 RepID=UPI00197C3BBC
LEGIDSSETGEHDGLHRISHSGVPHRVLGARRAGTSGSLAMSRRDIHANGDNANIREDSDTTVARCSIDNSAVTP